jgi:hypothetical protein
MRDSSARQATTEFGQSGFPHSLLELRTKKTALILKAFFGA